MMCEWLLEYNGAGFLYDLGFYSLEYPLQMGIFYPFNSYGNIGTIIFDSLIVANNLYNKVFEIPITYTRNRSSYYDTFYVSIDAGIIKMNINYPFRNHRWNLLRYKIIH